MIISKRINKISVSPTMKVAGEAKELIARGENVIDLSVGETDFPTPPNVKEAAKRAIDNNETRYTLNPGTVELRKAIADKLKRENGLEYSIKQIIVSSGAKQSLYNAIQSLVYVDDEVIFSAPYWVSYPEMVTLAHGQSVIIPTTEETGFKIKPSQLKKAISPYTKILILCNPSNPTGSCYTRKELEEIADIVLQNKFYVISDEIYEKLIYDNFELVSFPSLGEEIKKRTILVNGLSKSYAMTGWRIGYAAGPEEVIAAMNKLQSHSTSNASSISQAAGVEAFNGPQDYVNNLKNEFQARRDYLYNELTAMDGITCYKPQGAFYLFPNISTFFNKRVNGIRIENSVDFAMYLLREAKVATVPGSAFGAEGYIRLSYATSKEKLQEAVKRIKDALSKLQ
ncbi:pyridoxal phosphate-dependent aminotransferase [Melioribacteraceae bacterium 4301-Me]|uniref:pyridoxal phosphate-dependent aminotransferase n=1 Tax=Pyranulibacter aquaticus TaxID=3163344 RepID=UPI0035991DC6